jgi:RNase P protein component
MAKRKAKRAASRGSVKKQSGRGLRSRNNEKLPKDAVTLIVVLRAREGQETLLEAELRALVKPSRKE